MMDRRRAFTLALIALLIGGLKIWTHVSSASVLLIPTCLGDPIAVSVQKPLWQAVHCWGCYVAAFAVLWLGVIAYQAVRDLHQRRLRALF